MLRFGVVAYEDGMNEWFGRRVAGLSPRHDENRPYETVYFFRNLTEAQLAAQEMSQKHATVRFCVFTITTGYQSQPTQPTQFNVDDRGVLPA